MDTHGRISWLRLLKWTVATLELEPVSPCPATTFDSLHWRPPPRPARSTQPPCRPPRFRPCQPPLVIRLPAIRFVRLGSNELELVRIDTVPSSCKHWAAFGSCLVWWCRWRRSLPVKVKKRRIFRNTSLTWCSLLVSERVRPTINWRVRERVRERVKMANLCSLMVKALNSTYGACSSSLTLDYSHWRIRTTNHWLSIAILW